MCSAEVCGFARNAGSDSEAVHWVKGSGCAPSVALRLLRDGELLRRADRRTVGTAEALRQGALVMWPDITLSPLQERTRQRKRRRPAR